HLLTNARATRREIESLLRSAVVAGELQKDVNAPRLARTIEAIISGSLMLWACYREGSAIAWISQDLNAVLRPHLARRPGSKASRPDCGVGSHRPIAPKGKPG